MKEHRWPNQLDPNNYLSWDLSQTPSIGEELFCLVKWLPNSILLAVFFPCLLHAYGLGWAFSLLTHPFFFRNHSLATIMPFRNVSGRESLEPFLISDRRPSELRPRPNNFAPCRYVNFFAGIWVPRCFYLVLSFQFTGAGGGKWWGFSL